MLVDGKRVALGMEICAGLVMSLTSVSESLATSSLASSVGVPRREGVTCEDGGGCSGL